MSTEPLHKTSLNQEHLRLKAKLVPFGGWEMPLQYEGILAEHKATRSEAAVFDTSHMGEFLIDGGADESGLNRLVTQKLSDLAVGQCRYGALLNDNGKVLDDLIVYRLAEKRWMVVVNGATMEKDAAQFRKIITAPGQFSNISFQTAKIDVQGPRSRELLLKFIKGIEKLTFYTFGEFDVLGVKAIVSRTGYTGELGYEIYFPWARMPELWNKVISLGAKPAGLGCRDVLRLEMGYSLYGHELSEDISPLEAGLNRFIDWDKDFIGKAALLAEKAEGVKRQLIGLVSLSRRSPRAEHKIFSADTREIGMVTSGTFSPSLGRGIGMGFVEAAAARQGTKIFIGENLTDGSTRNTIEAEIAPKPFYQQGTFRA